MMMDPNGNAPIVLEALTRASSQDTNILKPAEEQLRQWETQPGFYSTLLMIFVNQEVDTNVRWLAVLYFKNGIEKYWRKQAPNAIPEEEKTFLKQQLITNFTEPVSQIATQLAVLISKIARMDCPNQWQELIPTLLEVVKCDTPLLQQRALLTLHHVVKALASKRLAPDRKMFEELTLSLFGFIFLLWKNYTESLFQAVMAQDAGRAVVLIEHSILALKVLRRLVVFGFKRPEENQDAINFISTVFQRIEDFLKSKNQLQAVARELFSRREKILTLLTKVILEFQEYHAEAFVRFIRQSLEITVRYNFTEEGKDLLHERFQVNVFNIMRSVLRCETYRPAKSIQETRNPCTVEAYKIKMEFFTAETLAEIGRRLVLHYFLLSQQDLEIWDADPEEFVADEGGDSWKYSLRPCTETLYLTLMKEFRSSLSPVILKLMDEYQGLVDTNDMNAILRKDAVLNSVGLASFDLYDDVDFDGWFTSCLKEELKVQHSNYRIIRRRIVWLLGCWIGVKFSPELRPELYKAIVPFLNAGEDLVVRLEAAFTLRSAVDDFDFKIEHFSPYLETSFGALFKLLMDVSECEVKMQVLHVMSFIIERMKTEIRPFAGALISYLPLLWKNSEEHNMLRCAILTTLTNLVWGLGAVSVTMYDFLLPVIKYSTDVTSEPHVYLCEDALDLWLATLQSAPAITPDLLSLYKNIPSLLELGGDVLRSSIKIVEAYVLLGPAEFLQNFSQSLVTSLSSLLTDLRSEGVIMVYKVVELVFRIFPSQGPSLFSSMLPEIVRTLLKEQEVPMVVGIKMAIIARMMMHRPEFLFEFLEGVSKQWNTKGTDLLGSLLDTFFDKMDNVIQPERRKLISLALLALLTTDVPVVADRFAGIINITVETLHDVCRTCDDGTEQDSLYLDHEAEESPLVDELESEHDKRMKSLSKEDPVYTVSLKNYTLSQLSSLENLMDSTVFQNLMQSVDCEIVDQLKQFMR